MTKISVRRILGAAVVVIMVALCMGSCCGRRMLTRSVADSVRLVREVEYVERVRDTVIYVTLPSESREVAARQDSSFLETSLARSRARINPDGTLAHSLENKPQRMPVSVAVKEGATTQATVNETVRTERIEVPVKMPPSGIQRFLTTCGIVAIAVLIAFAIWKISKLVRP